jgi:hypothetical protein
MRLARTNAVSESASTAEKPHRSRMTTTEIVRLFI